ncbi:MAG: hypothetical protein R3Y63_04390 [Eubacteriales bacterium]
MDMENIIPLALLACLCHEWGHYWAIRFFGGKVKSIHFTVIGAQMEVPQYFTYTQEFFSALAGPLVNLLFALALCHFFPLFAGLHLALGLLNLLPLSPLDGGRALSCLLALFLPLPWQQGIRYALHRLCALAVLAFGLWLFLEGGSITLFLLGIWLQSSHHADC